MMTALLEQATRCARVISGALPTVLIIFKFKNHVKQVMTLAVNLPLLNLTISL
jgi:hypothetical protein